MPQTEKNAPSKWFRIAVEGATTDGRQLQAQWLQEAAAAYNPQTYGARVWIEHQRSTDPDGLFKAQGDVVALSTQQVDIAGKKRLALFAQITPTDELKRIVNEQKQKIYTSIELATKFADTGKAYLTGLSVTDSPASLGTEILTFAAQHPTFDFFKKRKLHPDSLFTEAHETTIELTDDTPPPSLADTLMQQFQQLFSSKHKNAAPAHMFSEDALKVMIHCFSQQFAQHQQDIQRALSDNKALQQSQESVRQRVEQLSTQLRSLPDPQQSQRPTATGGGDRILTTF